MEIPLRKYYCYCTFSSMSLFSSLTMNIAVPFLLLLSSTLFHAGAQSIGVCYGLHGDKLPSRQEVIELYKARNIGKMRLYDADEQALAALRGTNIEVTIGVPDDRLKEFASNPSATNAWVETNIKNYWPDVKYKYIAVGNEQIPGNNAQYILQTMQHIYDALVSVGLQDQIKVSTAVHMAILRGPSFPPSNGTFSDDSLPYLTPIVKFLATIKSPLLVNVYPYFSYVGNPRDISLPYALFTSQTVVVTDGPYGYNNLFDAMVDTLYSALEKVGGPDVEIVVSESGWPSAGGDAATIDNARIYNQNLIRHVSRGTPRRPGRPIETYVFAMFNEILKQPPGIEQNFGLFYPSNELVYSTHQKSSCIIYRCCIAPLMTFQIIPKRKPARILRQSSQRMKKH